MQDEVPDHGKEAKGEKQGMTEDERQIYAASVNVYLSGIQNFVDFNKFCIGLNTIAFAFLVYAVEKFGNNPYIIFLLIAFCLYNYDLCHLWRRGLRDVGVEVGMIRRTIMDLQYGQAKGLFREKKTAEQKRDAAFLLLLKVVKVFRFVWLGAAGYMLLSLPEDKSLSQILVEEIGLWYDWLWKSAIGFLT